MSDLISYSPSDGDILPQQGYQMQFLTSAADVLIGGGAAGAGKTVALLMDAIRHVDVKGYGGIIFRTSYPQIMMQGGLWDESINMFPYIGGNPNVTKTEWTFEEKSRIAFRHLGHENDLLSYQGSQIPYIGFDELTHFSFKMFLYMMTRNRSVCGVRPCIRGTCNPDPDSWLADFISWWIDNETGYPIAERAGVLRYFIMQSGVILWGSSKEEVLSMVPDIHHDPLFAGVPKEELVKSVTFIPGTIQDNQELIRRNPQYLANLLAQDEETQARLLKGNWRIRADKLSLFDYIRINDMFSMVLPDDPNDQYYITCDNARFGRDLCVIGTWKGWKLIRIDILPKSDTNDVLAVILKIRLMYRGIPSSQIMIDQDGVGVKDAIDCRTFFGGGSATEVTRKIKADYKNKRTQCYYYLAEEKVNRSLISVNLENVWIHYSKTDMRKCYTVKLQGRERSVKDLIRDDLRTVKREDVDKENKKQITPKEQQKAAIGQRSPDFGDMMAMRSEFDFIRQPRYLM